MLASNQRRELLLEKITNNKSPITGTELAKEFKVSRQVIVQDIAILRAAGHNILATAQGYLIETERNRATRIIVSSHETENQIEEELNIIVDLGGKILDVIVEHPIYGHISSPLMISNRYQVQEFMDKIRTGGARPLSLLTGGVHLHTIEAENQDNLNKIEEALLDKGFLQQ
jgi:uncharacterized protein